MKIELTNNNSDYIAEEVDGGDGHFLIRDGGKIIYCHESDSNEWYVNSCLENFEKSIRAFNYYSDTVMKFDSENEQLIIVNELKQKLMDIECWDTVSNSYWKVIVEQAENGHL